MIVLPWGRLKRRPGSKWCVVQIDDVFVLLAAPAAVAAGTPPRARAGGSPGTGPGTGPGARFGELAITRPGIEHLHVVDDDLGTELLLSRRLVVPAAGLERPLHVDPAALGQELVALLRE